MTTSFVELALKARTSSKPVKAKTLYDLKLTTEDKKKLAEDYSILSKAFANSTMQKEYSMQIKQERAKRVVPHIDLNKIKENYAKQNA